MSIPETGEGFSVPERGWQALLLASSLLVVLVTIFCLSQGITIIFMHLYYFPIILLAYHYHRKGVALSAVLGLAYVALVCWFTFPDMEEIAGALVRFVVFVAIAAVVAVLSEALERTLAEMRRLSSVRESIIRNANVWLMVLDSRGTVLEWNRAAEEMSGYPAREVLGSNEVWKRLYPEKEYRREITERITGIIAKDNFLENLQTTIVTKAGERKTVLWNTRGLPGASGTAGSYIAIGVDITDRERVEQVSREYAEWYSTILRTTQDGYNLVDATGRLIEVNDNYCRMTGFSREELIGRYISDQDAEESRDVAFAHMQRILATGSDRFETRHRTSGGGTIDVEVSVVLQEKKRQFIVIVRDITERKRAELRLKESDGRQKEILESMIAGVVVIDPETHVITDVNAVAARLIGAGKDAIIGSACSRYICLSEGGICPVTHRGENIDSAERVLITHLGREIPILKSVVWIKIGNSFRLLESFIDITPLKQAQSALQEAYGRLKELEFIINQSPAIVWLWKAAPGWPVEYVSENLSILGYTPDDLTSGTIPYSSILHPDDLARVVAEVEEYTREGVVQFVQEYRIVKKTGEVCNTEDRTWIRRDETGVVTHYQGITLDITERKRAEEALRLSEERYRSLFDRSNDSIYIHDLSGQFIDANPSALAIIGCTREEVTTLTIADLIGEEELEKARDSIRKIIETGTESDLMEFLIRRKDGQHLDIETKASLILREGKPYAIMGIARDITRRKQAEREIFASKHLIEGIIDTIPARVFWKDRDLVYLGCNTRFAMDAGFSSTKEVIGKDDFQMGWRDQAELYRRDDRAVIDSGKPRLFIEEPQTTPDGATIHLLTSKVPLRNEKGEIIGVLGTYLDITDRKKTEEALRQAHKKLQLMSSITRHDILNQLTALRGYLELSGDYLNDPARLLEFLGKEEKAAATIESQITFTRDYQELGLHAPSWQSVPAGVRKAMEVLPMKAVRVEIALPALEIFADPLYEKVFYNLIDNALRYGGPGMTTIRFSAKESGGELLIICEDDGAGISEEDKKRLFTRGFGKNTGLGLFLSREILSITGLSITEAGSPGTGARFEITVPKGMYRITGTK